jgi:hypothetical protein
MQHVTGLYGDDMAAVGWSIVDELKVDTCPGVGE